jgi:acyl-coenzyme A synthetase/AMP-(fatty) acid ligase
MSRQARRQKLGVVKTFYMAGAPIPTETARRLMALGAKPQNVYGMTECGSHQYTKPADPMDVITSTCGKACAGYESPAVAARKTRTWKPCPAKWARSAAAAAC